MIAFCGFRWEVGTDWENYYQTFANITNLEFGESGFEFLYEMIVRISRFMSDEYTILLITTATLIISFTYITLIFNSPYPIFSILLLFSYSLNSSGFGYRQDLAIALTFFSFFFVLNQKFYQFITLIFFACLFHQSAIIFLPAYWIVRIKWNLKNLYILVVIITVFIVVLNKIGLLASLYSESALDKVSMYNELSPEEKSMNYGNPVLILLRGLINRSVLILPAVLFYFRNRENKKYTYVLNIVVFGVVLLIAFYPLGLVFQRFARYFDIFHILLIPLLIDKLNITTKWLLFISYSMYCFFKLSYVLFTDNFIYVPYKFVF